MTPHEIDTLADALAERLSKRLDGSMKEPDLMLDCHAAAKLSGCSVKMVERLIRSGELPSLTFGLLRRVRRSDVLFRISKGGSNE